MFRKLDPRIDPPEDTRQTVDFCRLCGEPIKEGDTYYEFESEGLVVCSECVEYARRIVD